MEAVLLWVQNNNAEGLSALELELKSEERISDRGRMLGQLISEGRYELVPIVKRYSNTEVWDQLVSQRFLGYSGINLQFQIGELGYFLDHFDEDPNEYNEDSEEEKEEGDINQREVREVEFNQEHGYVTPFFMALNLNRFDLCELLAPSQFPTLTAIEYTVLISKVKGGINPLTVAP